MIEDWGVLDWVMETKDESSDSDVDGVYLK
jgi:hypothetical protein